LASAITHMCAIDLAAGFSELRAALEDPDAAMASRGIFCEALGLRALTLALFGELHHHPAALSQMRGAMSAAGEVGPARAMAEICEYFIAGGRPETSRETLQIHRTRADEHSRDTPYRTFYNYATMLTCYLTNDYELGLRVHEEIIREGIWPNHNRRMH